MQDQIEDLPRKRYSVRRWAIESEKHKAILLLLKRGVGVIAIAKIVGVGVRTVQRRKALLNDEVNELVAAEDGGEVVEFKTIGRQSMRCEVHGLVSVWPCVACAAIGSQARPTNRADNRTQRPRAF